MKTLIAVTLAIVATVSLASANAQTKKDDPPRLEDAFNSHPKVLCRAALMRSVGAFHDRKKVGKEFWTMEEVEVFLAGRLTKAEPKDITLLSGPILEAVNDSVNVMLSELDVINQAFALAIITESCIQSINKERGGVSNPI